MKLANGYGSIYKLSGRRRNPWIVMLPFKEIDRINGVKRQILGYYHTKTEALTALADYHKDPTVYMNKDIYITDVYKAWSETHFKTVSEKTIKTYKNAYRHLEPLCNIPINSIKLQVMQDLINSKTFAIADRMKILLNLLFDYALFNDMVKKNYCKGLILPKKEIKIKRVIYTNEEIKKLWELKDNLYAKYALIQLYTGMRISEVLELKKSNVFLHERYMIGGMKTKAGTNRFIPICKKLLPLITELYNNSTSGRLMNDYRTVTTVINLSNKFMLSAGFKKHTSHDCRYTFVSKMEELKIPLFTTQRIIGHASGNLTQDLYTKIDVSDLIEAVDKLT